jgi:hypothetical protein
LTHFTHISITRSLPYPRIVIGGLLVTGLHIHAFFVYVARAIIHIGDWDRNILEAFFGFHDVQPIFHVPHIIITPLKGISVSGLTTITRRDAY